MKTHPKPLQTRLRLRASVLAVHGALALATSAQAETDPAVLALTQTKNQVELGVAYRGADSAKANEYNGVSGNPTQVLASFDLFGGGSFDADTAKRWRLNGSDLDTDSRALSGEYGVQGLYRLKFNYNELTQRTSDSFQTPYTLQSGNRFTLPSNWVVPVVPRASTTGSNARGLSPTVTNANTLVSGVSTAPTAAQLSQAAAMQAADLPAFNTQQLSTKRAQLGLVDEVQLTSRWSASVSANREHKEGARAFSALTRLVNGDQVSTLPQPVDQDHFQYRVGVNYVGDGSTFQAALDDSAFVNNVQSVTWAVWSDPTKMQSMGTAPSNHANKLSMSGSYALTPSTKLVSSLAYGRNTQNEAFINDGLTQVPLLPSAALHGLVVTETATIKVVNKATPLLSLNAAYKFDQRDNRTPVNTYGFYDVGEGRAAANSVFGSQWGSNINLNANRPYSKRVNQINLDANYKLAPTQNLGFSWETQNTDKYCKGSWIDCSDAAKSMEHTARAEWRVNPKEELSARVAFTKAMRKVDYNEDAFLALVPYANVSPTGAPGGASAYSTLVALGLTGYGPQSGLAPAATPGSALAFFFANNNALSNALYGNNNRISELVGMRRYNNANRDRNQLQGASQWQATEALSLQASGDVKRDSYTDSTYGLQSTQALALNLESNYTPTEDLSMGAFFSHEQQTANSAGNSYTANSTATAVNTKTAISGGCYATIATRNANNKTDPCLNWGNQTKDRVNTLGLTLGKNHLLGSKLDVSASLIMSKAHTDINISGGNYVNNPLANVAGAGAAANIAAYYIPATALPSVATSSQELHLNGRYSFDKGRSLRVGYSYQRLRTTDFAYEGLQAGGLTGVLPTNEQTLRYDIQTIGVAYLSLF